MRSIPYWCQIATVMRRHYTDNWLAIAKACGFSTGMPSLWRHGKRRPSKAVALILRLVELHGVNALFHGELAQTPSKLAQDSAQVPKPKRKAKRKAK